MSLFHRLSASYFFYFAILGIVSTFLGIFLDSKGFSSREIGESLAIFTVAKIIAPSLWSIFADKTGQQLAIMRLGALLALLCFTGLFWLSSYGAIALALALFSLFWTAILPQLEVHTLATIRRNNKIYARIRLWGSLGFIALAILAGEAMSYFSSQAFIVLGVIMLLALFFSTLTLTESTKSKNIVKVDSPIKDKIINSRFILFFFSLSQ